MKRKFNEQILNKALDENAYLSKAKHFHFKEFEDSKLESLNTGIHGSAVGAPRAYHGRSVRR